MNYTGSGYKAIRDILTESPKSKVFSEEKIESTKTRIDLIKKLLNKIL
jgi:ribosomal protein L17